MKRKRAALYVRVSTDEQNTNAQERALKEYVQRRGWLLYHIYKDTGISGSVSSRPGPQRIDERLPQTSDRCGGGMEI
jgi:DNA invertase Pin-like site-specific DNA recombinase